MKAIVFQNYGAPNVLRYEEIERPTAGNDEVLIRVRAASINPLDWRLMRGEPYVIRATTGLRQPKTRLGVDLAGQVEAVGRNVTEFQRGDEVFGTSRGVFAEYVCAYEKELVLKPAGFTFEQVAALPVAGFAALQGLRDKGRIQSAQKVLINGAAGGVGTIAVQIAKSFGADVTAVCSTRNVETVRLIGADRVIDYTKENFTAGEPRYDCIIDCYATHSLSAYRRVLNPRGIYVGVGGPVGSTIGILADLIRQLAVSSFINQTLTTLMAKIGKEDLAVLSDLMHAGKVSPVIGRRYSLKDVPEAMRYLGEGHARGKIIINYP